MTTGTELPGRTPSLPSTVDGITTHELVVKRSRFVTLLAHATSVEEADTVVRGVRRDRWDARHHCVALVVGPHGEVTRSSDDGEPAGTAGAPMLDVLRRRDLTDLVAVVSRYFGGVLLGTGGLVRAYSGAVDEAVGRAPVVARREVDRVLVRVPHQEAGRTEHLVREWCGLHGSQLVSVTYGEAAVVELLVPPDGVARLRSDLASFSSGRLDVDVVGREVADVRPSSGA